MLYTVKVGINNLAAFGVMEHIVMGYTVFCCAAGGGANQGVIGIAAGGNGGVAAPIRLLRHYSRGGVSAGVGSSNTCVVRLREGETIRHYSTSDNATGIGERGISGWRLGYADCFFVGRCGAHDGEMVGVFFDLMFGLNRCVFLYMFTANLLKNAKKK